MEYALKKENWWIWLLLTFVTQGISIFVLAIFLKIYDKKAWYANWKYWLIGVLCLIFPAAIMFAVFSIQINCEVCAKLNVPHKEIYTSPYIWILSIIIPIFGWLFLGVLSLYITFSYIVMLAKGEGEKYID